MADPEHVAKMKDRIIQYYEKMWQLRSDQHDHKEICAWGGLVLYVLFAGTVSLMDLPEKHNILFMHILTLFVIIVFVVVCCYISNQLKLKDHSGAHLTTASLFLSELISEEKTEDELNEYLEIKDIGKADLQCELAFPEKFLRKSLEIKGKGRGFQDATRYMIYGILILVTILVLSAKWANVIWTDETLHLSDNHNCVCDLPQRKCKLQRNKRNHRHMKRDMRQR